MEENFDKFISSQQHTTGSKETLEQSFTEEKDTEQTTHTKLLTRTQESTNKNSPQEKVVADTSKQYSSDASNISPSQSMDDECISKVTYTSYGIQEFSAKPERSGNFSNTKALKTEEFGENTQSSENPIDDTKDQTLNYDLVNTDQTSSETPVKDVYENIANSFEADDSQNKLHYSETAQNLPETIQGNLKNQCEFEILNFPSERQQSENDSLASSEGKEILKAKCDSRHDCKLDSDSNQTRPNFDCKFSQKTKKQSSKKESKSSEKTTNNNEVVTKIPQAETNPESKDSINKSIENHQITESSELSKRTSSDSRCNTEMSNNSGITYSKLTLGVPLTPVVSPESSYLSEITREPDDSTSREPKNSESEDFQTKGVVYTPSRESTEIFEISENLCGLNISKKSLTVAEQHNSVKNLTTSESAAPETSYKSVSELDGQGKSDKNIESGENTAPDRTENTVQNTSSTEISSKPSEIQLKSDEVSRESVSVVSSSGAATFNLDMGALITDVIDRISTISLDFRSLVNYWAYRNPMSEINMPENTQTHRHIVLRFNCIRLHMIRIAHSANSSVMNILERIGTWRPRFEALGLVLHSLNAMVYYLRDVRDDAGIFMYLRSLCSQNASYEHYYQAVGRSLVAIHRALMRIIEQLRRLEIEYRNDNAGTKKPDT